MGEGEAGMTNGEGDLGPLEIEAVIGTESESLGLAARASILARMERII